MQVLAVEPFYGGSHRAFLDGWIARSRHDWTLITFSPHHWKWRMRHASLDAAEQIAQAAQRGGDWDVLFCSDMVNLAELKGLSGSPLEHLPSILYFHENQLTYPVRNHDPRDLHFVVTNFVSAVAADRLWFNSAFHRREFLTALPDFWKRFPDHRPLMATEQLAAKSEVQSPGVDSSLEAQPLHGSDVPTILWAARWEFDKNPEAFFRALDARCVTRRPWRLSVLGESFPESPACFAEARAKWNARIRDWGFQATRSGYEHALARADLFVSTAIHEFFGIAVLEAIGAGAVPLLPRRLSYPELLNLEATPELADCFYDCDEELPAALAKLLDRSDRPFLQQVAREQTRRFDWDVRALELDEALEASTR